MYEGDNDIAFGFSPEEIRDYFEQLFSILQEKNPGTRMYVVSIKPSIKREGLWPQQMAANRLLQDMCRTNVLMTYIDVATQMFNDKGHLNTSLFISDDLHMNKQGYALFAEKIKKVLMSREIDR